MGQVLIRNLDDALIADYKRAAAEHGRSLETELREALAAMRPRKRLMGAAFIAMSERLRAGTSNKAGSIEGWKLIREDRDR